MLRPWLPLLTSHRNKVRVAVALTTALALLRYLRYGMVAVQV